MKYKKEKSLKIHKIIFLLISILLLSSPFYFYTIIYKNIDSFIYNYLESTPVNHAYSGGKSWKNFEEVKSFDECKFYNGEWKNFFGGRGISKRRCSMFFPDAGKECKNSSECLSGMCLFECSSTNGNFDCTDEELNGIYIYGGGYDCEFLNGECKKQPDIETNNTQYQLKITGYCAENIIESSCSRNPFIIDDDGKLKYYFCFN